MRRAGPIIRHSPKILLYLKLSFITNKLIVEYAKSKENG